MANNFTFDPFMNSAKDLLQQISTETLQMSGFDRCSTTFPQQISCSQTAPQTNFLATQLNSWQQSHQNLQKCINAIQIEQPQILNTLFKFEPDHFKMLVDVRGYVQSELKVTVGNKCIEITATHEQSVREQGGAGYANRTIIRTYDMPMGIMCEHVLGNLSPDGTLFIAAPWATKNCC